MINRNIAVVLACSNPLSIREFFANLKKSVLDLPGPPGPRPAPGGAFAPAKIPGPAPGGAFAPANFTGPAPGGAFAPATFAGPAPGGA